MDQFSASDTSDSEKEQNDQKKKAKLRGIWLWLGVLILVLLFVGGGFFAANSVIADSELCANCHEMLPEYYTWQATAHSQVKCTDCHLPVDKAERFFRNFRGVKQIVLHFSGSFQLPITIKQPVSNENCLACHSTNRVVTPSGDLIISHELHDKQGVKCLSCHAGIAHGRIMERGKTEQTKPEMWTAAMGQEETKIDNIKPKMIQCLQCHREWKVSTQCEKCHKKIPTPESHKPGNWRVLHGQEAWKDVNKCSQCHYEEKLQDIFDKQAVADYVRANKFCYSCHMTYKPPTHMYGWPHDHAALVNRNEVPYCITCHDVDEPKNKLLIGTTSYCNKCHGNYFVGGRKTEPIQYLK